MSISYEEAISTLHSIFSSPWTEEHFDTILQHFNDNMERTVDAILRHGDDTPQQLLRELSKSNFGSDQIQQDAELARKFALEQHSPSTTTSTRGKRDPPLFSPRNGQLKKLILAAKTYALEQQHLSSLTKYPGEKRDPHPKIIISDEREQIRAEVDLIDDEEEANAMHQESVASCMQIIIEHLREFLEEQPDSTYEEWIRDIHPDNVDDQRYNSYDDGLIIDHRFYVETSDHRIIWNENMDTSATNVTNQDSFLNRKVQPRYKHGAPLPA